MIKKMLMVSALTLTTLSVSAQTMEEFVNDMTSMLERLDVMEKPLKEVGKEVKKFAKKYEKKEVGSLFSDEAVKDFEDFANRLEDIQVDEKKMKKAEKDMEKMNEKYGKVIEKTLESKENREKISNIAKRIEQTLQSIFGNLMKE